MDVIEEVIRKKSSVKTKNWRKAHKQIKALLEQKFDFSQVYEETFKHYEEKNKLYLEIYCISSLDQYSKLKLELDIDIQTEDLVGNVNIASTATLITTYPEDTPFRKSLFYFALRSMWDKIYYGWARAKFRDFAKQLSNDVNEQLIEFLSTVK